MLGHRKDGYLSSCGSSDILVLYRRSRRRQFASGAHPEAMRQWIVFRSCPKLARDICIHMENSLVHRVGDVAALDPAAPLTMKIFRCWNIALASLERVDLVSVTWAAARSEGYSDAISRDDRDVRAAGRGMKQLHRSRGVSTIRCPIRTPRVSRTDPGRAAFPLLLGKTRSHFILRDLHTNFMTSQNPKYVIISPVRDEEEYVERTIDSVV